MYETTIQAPSAEPLIAPDLTAEQAREQRGYLMADGAWRDKAMVPGAREYAQLQALDLKIAGVADDEPEQPEPAPAFAPPAGEYDLPETALADAEGLQAWKLGLRAANVDNDLAAVAWQVAEFHAARDLDPDELARQAASAEATLRGRWGDEYEARLAAANEEGKRIFSRLPASLTDGMSWAEFALTTGIGTSATVIEMLHQRATARTQGAEHG